MNNFYLWNCISAVRSRSLFNNNNIYLRELYFSINTIYLSNCISGGRARSLLISFRNEIPMYMWSIYAQIYIGFFNKNTHYTDALFFNILVKTAKLHNIHTFAWIVPTLSNFLRQFTKIVFPIYYCVLCERWLKSQRQRV